MIFSASKVKLRWVTLDDMPDVLQIEKASFPNPWEVSEFFSELRQSNCSGIVAERCGEILGYVIYATYEAHFEIINLAVKSSCRRSGIGTLLLLHVTHTVTALGRSATHMAVRETNLDAQLFLKKNGFKVSAILKGLYGDSLEDSYMFTDSMKGKTPCFVARNVAI